MKKIIFGCIVLFALAASASAQRVYCNSQEAVLTRLLFFFEAANPSGQALASIYAGPKVIQQKIRWEHTAEDHLIGKRGDAVLFDLHFEGFGAEGSGILNLTNGAVDLACTKI